MQVHVCMCAYVKIFTAYDNMLEFVVVVDISNIDCLIDWLICRPPLLLCAGCVN